MRLTNERPLANDWTAEASSIAKSRNEKDLLKAAACLGVGFEILASARMVNI